MRIFLFILCLFPSTLWAENAPGQITVTGQGRADAQPDMAMISVGVSSQAASAKQALAQTNSATARVLERLKAAGIAARDLQTGALSLSPRWDQRGEPGQERAITGYLATNSVRVRVRQLADLGKMLDTAVELGANQFNGLSFGLQDPGPQTDKARRAAVADALARARLYAAAAGVKLGPILSISEAGVTPPPMPQMRSMAAAEAVPLAPGEVTLEASVTVVFAIGQAE